MQIILSIVLQSLLLVLALAITLLRYWVRLGVEKRKLTLPDYLVWGGWLCTLGWFICSIVALRIQIDHPLVEPDLVTDSVGYLVTVFIASYMFDVGLYFPKAALIAFYWWLIPYGFRRLRVAVYVGTAYMICAFIASILTDTLICRPISNNWSIENQLSSLWNTYNALAINWALNWSTDLLLFVLPFFIINCLKLRKRQKVALCGVFSLGLITIVISLARFLVYTVSSNYSLDDASGNLWCTAEMCIATIVVSLPTLKVLIVRSSPTPTSNRSNNGYMNSDSKRHLETYGSRNPRKSFSHLDTYRSHVEAGPGEDEIELVFQDSRKSSTSPTRTASAAGTQDEKEGVRVTTDVTVVRDVF